MEGLQARLERARQVIAQGRAQPGTLEGWEEHPAFARIADQRAMLERLNLPVPYGQPHDSVSTDRLRVGGRDLLNFSGYNYLALSGDPEVSAAAKAAIDRFGTSASASRLAAGEITLHGELERAIAAMLGTESCLVFVSGYGTNVATIGHLFGPADLVIHDALAHSSILVGAQLSGAHRLAFPHNDVAALDRLLAEYRPRYERAAILVEGVYSMDGDIAPLDRLLEVKRRHRAMLMVDEAHSIGVLGRGGGGIREHFGIAAGEVELWMGTLSKTLAACGGYIAGEGRMIDVLRYSAPGFIYSVGLTPPDTAAALAALQVMRREPERIARLHEAAHLFRETARRAGLNTGTSAGSAIVPIIVGDSILTLRLAHALFEAGINVHPIIYPAIEERSARLRFFITSAHTGEQIRETVAAVESHLERLRAEGSSA